MESIDVWMLVAYRLSQLYEKKNLPTPNATTPPTLFTTKSAPSAQFSPHIAPWIDHHGIMDSPVCWTRVFGLR